jgi:hypothetical protein
VANFKEFRHAQKIKSRPRIDIRLAGAEIKFLTVLPPRPLVLYCGLAVRIRRTEKLHSEGRRGFTQDRVK